jgi:hypothetical protein
LVPVHPIERLRYVARAAGADQRVLVSESAAALADLGLDPQGIVTSCRRLIAKHPTAGSLWWMSARMLTAVDPMREAWACVREIDADGTSDELAYALADDLRVLVVGWPEQVAEALVRRGDVTVLVVEVDGEGSGLARRLARSDVEATVVSASGVGAAAAAVDLVVLEAGALGPDGFLATPGSRAAAAVAYCEQVPVWVVCGVGRALPEPLWRALLERVDDEEPWDREVEVVPLGITTAIVGPQGLVSATDAAALALPPVAPELLREIPN